MFKNFIVVLCLAFSFCSLTKSQTQNQQPYNPAYDSVVGMTYDSLVRMIFNFGDNEPPKMIPILDSLSSEQRISKFKLCLQEYRQQHNSALVAKTARGQEIAMLKTFLVFIEMQTLYANMTYAETKAIFINPSQKFKKLLPTGIVVDGFETDSIDNLCIYNPSGDIQKDFEFFLEQSYVDIDYMGMWGINTTSTHDSITTNYGKELSKKGIKFTFD